MEDDIFLNITELEMQRMQSAQMQSEDLESVMEEYEAKLLEFSQMQSSDIEDVISVVVDIMDYLRDYGWKSYNVQKFEGIFFYKNIKKSLFLKIDFNTKTFCISNNKRIENCSTQSSIFTNLVSEILSQHKK